jgi:hypothetical protein
MFARVDSWRASCSARRPREVGAERGSTLRARIGPYAQRLLEPCGNGDGRDQCFVEPVGAGDEPSQQVWVGGACCTEVSHLRVGGLGLLGLVAVSLASRSASSACARSSETSCRASRRLLSSSSRTASAASPANQSSPRCGRSRTLLR